MEKLKRVPVDEGYIWRVCVRDELCSDVNVNEALCEHVRLSF